MNRKALTAERTTLDPLHGELVDIKRLMMLLLFKAGATQSEVATALQIDQGRVSKMMPARQIREFSQNGRGGNTNG